MKQPFNPLVFRGVELGVILPPRRHLEGRRDDFFFFFFGHTQGQRTESIGICRIAARDTVK